jgi:hypothetical protein
MLTFTAVVALATVVQAIFASRLFKLQKAIEAARNAVDVSVSLSFARATLDAQGSVELHVANLCEFPVWVEKATIHVTLPDGQKGIARIPLQKVVSRGEEQAVFFHKEIREAAEATKHGWSEIPFRCQLSIVVEFRANGQWHSGGSAWYKLKWNNSLVSEFERVA